MMLIRQSFKTSAPSLGQIFVSEAEAEAEAEADAHCSGIRANS